jgi:hypothetical protein
MPEESPNQQPPEKQPEQQQPKEQTEPISFPWLIFCVAAIFDLLGLVPLVNLFSETIASLFFGFWQKQYEPELDPFTNIIVAKIIDVLSLGILPSNMGIVVFAYFKKKSLQLSKTTAGQWAFKKLTPQENA